MMLIKLIILVAISCSCSLISCASENEFESEIGSSEADNGPSDLQRSELDKLGKLLFMTRDNFEQKRPRILEPNEVLASLNQFANLQQRSIGSQTDSELQLTSQTSLNQHNEAEIRWTTPSLLFMVKALQEIILLAEEENEEKTVKTCESLVIMKNVKETSSLMAEKFPVLNKFTEEKYGRIIEKCVHLLKSRFELFLSMLHRRQLYVGRDFGEIIVSAVNKLRLFGFLGNAKMKRLAFTGAAARFVETFGGQEKTGRNDDINEVKFRNIFMNQTESMMKSICCNVRKIFKKTYFTIINVLLQINPDKLKSLDDFDEYKSWMSVAAICHIWSMEITRKDVYDAHVSFHMDLKNLEHLKSLRDALFSPSASRISDANEIESGLKHFRNELASREITHDHMFELNVNELDVLLGIKNRNSETGDMMQQIEPFIQYYESIGAHNIVFYLNSLLNGQTDDRLTEIETILRAGNEELANYPQINENLRELRRFVQGSNNIMAELKTSDLLTGLTDYFLSNLQNLQQMSEVEDYHSRKDLVSRWFNLFMDDNCEKYKYTFDGILPVNTNLRSERALSRFDDELKLALFNVILCNDMDNNILNHIDELTRLISSRVDGGGPSNQIDEMTQIRL